MDYRGDITGKVIRHLRKEKHLSQEVLSGLAGISRTHLTMIETGDKNANVDTLWKLAGALDMRLSELFQHIEEAHERIEKDDPGR